VTIIAGEQVARDDARAELERLRALLRARVATVPDAKDVSGSPGLTSKSSDFMSRVSPSAATRPHAAPMPDSSNPWRTNIPVTSCNGAPSASRMPISRVRCDTE